MAQKTKFLDNVPDEFGPYYEIETGYGFGPGLVWTPWERVNKLYRVTWGLTDQAGTDAPPATWSVGGETFRLRNAQPDRGYGDTHGTFTAVYFLEGTKSWVT